jgi:hypothetical protein
MDDIDQHAAELLARLEAERETRIADKIAAGLLVEVPLCIVGGSETSVRAQVEQAKADRLAELRAAGDRREVVFRINTVVTGVVLHGEPRDPDERAPTAPGFASGEDAPRQHLPVTTRPPRLDSAGERPAEPAAVDEGPQPPLVETPFCVQVGRCRDDDDPGTIVEGYFSVSGSTVTVTNSAGGRVGSRVMLAGEDARAVAKRLLREKTAPEEEFTRALQYPTMRGWA